jgi:uncharacterized protein (TIGR02453 family)
MEKFRVFMWFNCYFCNHTQQKTDKMDAASVLDFLSQLTLNNNREWFQQNKSWYEKSRKEVEGFVSEIIATLSAIDPSLQTPAMKDCIFRIFRDVRFGADKSPYKTNFGAFIARGGRKSSNPGYYFHFEPGKSMLAGGVYMPQPDTLKLLRNEVYYHSSELKSIVEKPSFVKYFDKLDDFDKMKKTPKDFPADFPDIDLLKYRSFIVSKTITDDVVSDQAKYQKLVLDMVKELQPFMAFLNRAISNG